MGDRRVFGDVFLMNVTQNHVGQVHIVANERGGQFRGTVMAVTPAGAVMDVYGQKDGAEWMTLPRPPEVGRDYF